MIIASLSACSSHPRVPVISTSPNQLSVFACHCIHGYGSPRYLLRLQREKIKTFLGKALRHNLILSFFFWPCLAAGIPWPGIGNKCCLHWELRILITGLPGKSLKVNLSYLCTVPLFLWHPSILQEPDQMPPLLGSLPCSSEAVGHWRLLTAGITLRPICIFCILYYLINGVEIQLRPESILHI